MFKWKRKSYRRDLAPRAWRYVIDAATKQYARETAPDARWWRVLAPSTRDIVSVWMTDEFERLADSGQFDELVARKKPSPQAARVVAAEPLAALFTPPRMLPPAPTPAPAPAPPVRQAPPQRAYRWPLQPKAATAVEVATAPAAVPAAVEAPAAPAAAAVIRRRKPAPVVQAVFEGPTAEPEAPTALAEVISISPLAPMPEVIVARRRTP